MFWLVTHFEIVAAVTLTGIATLFVVQQRRTPQATLAWVLSFLLVPYLAIPVFIALGVRKRGSQFAPMAFTSLPGTAEPASGLDGTLRAYGIPPATSGHTLTLLADGAAAHAAQRDIVATAAHSLDVMMYAWDDDAVGRGLAVQLQDCARRGVAVRVAIDRLGGFFHPRGLSGDLRAAGAEVDYFSPLFRLRRPVRFNLRNHRKMIVADGLRVLAGGRNVGAHYTGPAPDDRIWTDLSYLLTGPAVATHLDAFHSTWPGPARTVTLCPADGEAVVQMVPSGPDLTLDALHDATVQAIHAARSRVWIATPYFVPTEGLMQAVATAARRGLDVRILVPARSNKRVADLARGPFLRDLQSAGCMVLLFGDGMMHAKACLIDATAWVGSVNFDVRSMLLNFEMALALHDAASTAALADWFTRLEGRSTRGMPAVGRARRVAEGVFRLGAPIL